MPFGIGPGGWFTHPWSMSPYWYGLPRFPCWWLSWYGYGYPLSKEEERQILEQDAGRLEEELGRIRKRLEELKE